MTFAAILRQTNKDWLIDKAVYIKMHQLHNFSHLGGKDLCMCVSRGRFVGQQRSSVSAFVEQTGWVAEQRRAWLFCLTSPKTLWWFWRMCDTKRSGREPGQRPKRSVCLLVGLRLGYRCIRPQESRNCQRNCDQQFNRRSRTGLHFYHRYILL